MKILVQLCQMIGRAPMQRRGVITTGKYFKDQALLRTIQPPPDRRCWHGLQAGMVEIDFQAIETLTMGAFTGLIQGIGPTPKGLEQQQGGGQRPSVNSCGCIPR